MATRHREVETAYDVGEDVSLPPLADLPDVDRVEGPRTVHLRADYYDTDALALARHGITLRRRTGGEDEGWHLKLPASGARDEIRAPLGRSTRTPPTALRRVIRGVVRDARVGLVATIATERSTASLLDAEGSLLAEICDDRVVATRVALGSDEEHRWREWEVEVHAARPRLTKAAAARMRDAGAEVASRQSKLGRLLRLDLYAPASDRPAVGSDATEHDLLAGHLEDLVIDIHRLDPLARADIPDAVHQLRVRFRRLRASLKTFDSILESRLTDPVRDDLKWIGDILGRPRDLEVLQSRLSALVMTLPPPMVREGPGSWTDSRLRAERRIAHRRVLDAMGSDRYFSLVDGLDSWQDAPPWTDRADKRATKRLPKTLHHEWRRVEKAVAKVDEADDAERPALLHDVRKAAKRARYAAETVRPVLGSEAGDLAKDAKSIQRPLGVHHDTVVAIRQVLTLADQARDEGRDTFTFGVLTARLVAELVEHEQAFHRAWEKVQKRH